MQIHELIIIGGGPAGVSAAIYAARRKMDFLIFESGPIGGQANKAHLIENYPGIPSITGQDFGMALGKQLESLGVKVKGEKVIGIKEKRGGFVITTSDKNNYSTKTIIISTGSAHRTLGAKNEGKFLGKGISYCVSCDAPLFKGKTVAVVGGGDAAVDGAMALSDICGKVYLIHRREGFRAADIRIDKLKAKKNVEMKLNCTIESFEGKAMLEKLILKDTKTGKQEGLQVDGCFIEIGTIPTAELVKGIGVKTDKNGFIEVDRETKTNIKGIFAAGDVTGNIMQVVSAASDGATAAISAYKFARFE